MSTDWNKQPIGTMEVSLLTQEAFRALGLVTISDLLEVSALQLLDTARSLAGDRNYAWSLREVTHILADMGLSLRPEIACGSFERFFRCLEMATAERGLVIEQDDERRVVSTDKGPIAFGPNRSGDGLSRFHSQELVGIAQALYDRAREIGATLDE